MMFAFWTVLFDLDGDILNEGHDLPISWGRNLSALTGKKCCFRTSLSRHLILQRSNDSHKGTDLLSKISVRSRHDATA